MRAKNVERRAKSGNTSPGARLQPAARSPLANAEPDTRLILRQAQDDGASKVERDGARRRKLILRQAQDDGASKVERDGAGRRKLILRQAQDDGAEGTVLFGQKQSAIERVARTLEKRERDRRAPRIESFMNFLLNHARVKSGAGYVPYHFEGREALIPIVERLDKILSQGEPDVSLAICGGAQFGKTVLLLNLLAYLVAVQFRNVGYYLPDDDLVSGLVDGKLRPDVLDQIPWLARLLAVGKTLAPSGRAVNRKGAFLCTDGERTALAFMRGLGKIPTSFSMDVVIQDEKDDLREEYARFLAGRMTASNLRLSLIIGTQRYHGAGQNLAFTEGTQHIGLIACPGCGRAHNPETLWPGICRLDLPDLAPGERPWLTVEGHFAFPDGRRLPIAYAPSQNYFLGCVACGAALDRDHPQWQAQAPEREAQRRFSYRISQLLIPGIDLAQIVAAWQLAIRDPAQMNVFCTDRLALPKSATQTLTPHDLQAARGEYELRAKSEEAGMGAKRSFAGQGRPQMEFGNEGRQIQTAEGHRELILRQSFGVVPPAQDDGEFSSFTLNYAGLDLGDQCWFVARTVDRAAPHTVRLLWIEPIAAERVRTRVPELFRALDIRVLCVDAGPLRDLARDLTFQLNGLDEDAKPSAIDPTHNITFSVQPPRSMPALRWHAASEKWQQLRCIPVEFTQREGQGLRQKVARTQDGRLYPLLAAHRDESIERVITELLPPSEARPRLLEQADGIAAALGIPRFLLPQPTGESREALALYERHLLAGSRQERTADGRTLRYLDQCENHFLLATAYAALAELLVPAPIEARTVIPAFRSFPLPRSHSRRERSVVG